MKNNVNDIYIGKATKSPLRKFTANCSMTCFIALIISAILISLTAVVLMKANVPHTLLEPLTTILTVLATLISSYGGTAKGETNVTHGLASGALMFAVIFVVSLAFGDGDITYQTLIKLIALTSAGGIGSLAGANAKRKAKLKI